ncbi:hypothetical protein AL515_22625 [Citrobacter sp. FDAARGOS_156]|nr:hypothetical protein AL515_22625 [Citrobacter sp. FDAARGOS_156]AYL60602.1 hypothetical protein CUC49_02520 [Citrobacter pasteurii]
MTFSITHWLCGFSILEKADRIAIGYWENDSFVIFLSPLKQSHSGINSHIFYGYQSGLDEKNYVQI